MCGICGIYNFAENERQAASVTYIKQKAPHYNPGANSYPPGPWLTALNLPKVGTTFRVQVPRSWLHFYQPPVHSLTYLLAFGVSNPDVLVPGVGGWLFTSADIVVGTGQPSSGSRVQMVTLSFPIPNSPQWLGVRFYQQVHSLGLGFFPGTQRPYHKLSRGMKVVIGT